jgi:hypothetical protein
MIHTNTIPSYNLDYLEQKIAKLNKRAIKLGVSGFVLSTKPAAPLVFRDELLGNIKRTVPQVEVTITGNTPKIDGWEFLASIDNLGEAGGIINFVPSATESFPAEVVLNAWRECSCDHCGINRFRKQSFVLRKKHEFMLVGRSCLKDYMGHASAQQLIALAGYIDTIIGTGDEARHGGGYRTPDTFDVQGIILRTLAEVKVFGYTSAKTANAYNEKLPDHSSSFKTTTAQEVKHSFQPDFLKSFPFAEWKARIEKGATALGIKVILGKSDVAKADAIMAWALEQPNGDFMSNAKTLVQAGFVRMKHMGYIVGLVAFYNSAHEPKREYVKKAPSQHIGKIKDKIEVTGKVTFLRGFQSDWGFSTLIKIETPEGNQVSWFANGGSDVDLSIGDSLKVKGTIKAHEAFNGFNTTVLNRVKTLEHKPLEIKPATAEIGIFA